MLSYKAINGLFSPALSRVRALTLPSSGSQQTSNSSIGNFHPFGSGLDACGVTQWTTSFGWPGHDDSSSNHQAVEQLKQSPDPLRKPSDIKRAVIGTGIAGLILAVAILNQQIILAIISTLERAGRSAEIQGALAKPLGHLLSGIF